MSSAATTSNPPRRRGLVLPAVGAAIAVLIAAVFAWHWYLPVAQERQLIEAAMGRVRASLADPASATFRDVRAVGSHVCGEVAGKFRQIPAPGLASVPASGFRAFYVEGAPGSAVAVDADPASRLAADLCALAEKTAAATR